MKYRLFLLEPVFAKNVLEFVKGPWNQKAVVGWKHPDTGEVKQDPEEFGAGAMWQAFWYPRNSEWANEEEPHLIISTPGGAWDVDSRASNCTRKRDRDHRCWRRHGKLPHITVDKIGDTCRTGVGGDIVIEDFHGFVRDGFLITIDEEKNERTGS